MSNYIDADKLIRNLNDLYPIGEIGKVTLQECVAQVKYLSSTMDVRENVHGEWIKYGDKYKCNKCFATMQVNPINPNLKDRFCYFCGADMRKGEKA